MPCLIFSNTAEKAAFIIDFICDASLNETINITVEKDATANDNSDESKNKKQDTRYIVDTFSIFQIGSCNVHGSQGSHEIWTRPGFLLFILE